jgi:hypothetical protein
VQFIQQESDQVTSADYHIFGIGIGTDDLRYIGWTAKSIDDEDQEILSELVQAGDLDLGDKISIFEIESVSSMSDAIGSVTFWQTYYRALGLEVLVDHRSALLSMDSRETLKRVSCG